MVFTRGSRKNKGGLSPSHSPPGTADSAKRGDPKSQKEVHQVDLDVPKKNANPSNYFNLITSGEINLSTDARSEYLSSSPCNTLSADILKLPTAKKIQQEVEKEPKYDTTFIPITTFSSHPDGRVTYLKISDFPPDYAGQNLGVHGTCSTRIPTGVGEDGSDTYEFFSVTPQNSSIHASTTIDIRIIGREFDLTEKTAQIVSNECGGYFNVHPFTGPFNQADPKKKNTTMGKNYWAMRKRFDRLVMEHFIDVIKSGLLSSLVCLVIQGKHAWDFFTVQFPQEFPIEYQTLILPMIIQHGPIPHGTVISGAFPPTPRQGYGYCEAMVSVFSHLRGSTDYHQKLIGWELPGNMFSYGRTKNDGKDSSDVFTYTVSYMAYEGDDKRVFVGFDRDDLEQLMKDEVVGKGCPDIHSQKKLLKRPQEMASLGLTIEIEHFWTYYQRRGKQMRLSDWGVQNREGAYKAWMEYVDGKRAEGDRKRSGKMRKMVGAVLNAAKSS